LSDAARHCRSVAIRVPIALISAAIALSGCASLAVGSGADALYSSVFRIKIEDVSKLSQDELLAAQAIILLPSAQAPDSIDKGPVAGLACKLSVAPLIPKFFWHPPLSEELAPTPEDVARLQLKVKALRAGANAVVESQCRQHGGIDWGNNCFDSWVCTGRAVALR
jgi:hypothetical protein